jgi:hypothetical protein
MFHASISQSLGKRRASEKAEGASRVEFYVLHQS